MNIKNYNKMYQYLHSVSDTWQLLRVMLLPSLPNLKTHCWLPHTNWLSQRLSNKTLAVNSLPTFECVTAKLIDYYQSCGLPIMFVNTQNIYVCTVQRLNMHKLDEVKLLLDWLIPSLKNYGHNTIARLLNIRNKFLILYRRLHVYPTMNLSVWILFWLQSFPISRLLT